MKEESPSLRKESRRRGAGASNIERMVSGRPKNLALPDLLTLKGQHHDMSQLIGEAQNRRRRCHSGRPRR